MVDENYPYNEHGYFILNERGPNREDVYVCRYAWIRDQAQRKGKFAVLAGDIHQIKNLKQELAKINKAECAAILADALEIFRGKIISEVRHGKNHKKTPGD